MYLSITFLAPLVSLLLAAAHPEVTPGPRSPAHHRDLIKFRALERHAAELQGRQKAGELAFCFGRNSICENSNDLNDECDKFYGNNDPTQWYECLCTNGYVSTREACGWCNDAWGIDQIDVNELNSQQCTSYSFKIAPVPESVLAQQTSYNSTWTGTLLGTVTIGVGGGRGSDDSTTTTSKRTSPTSGSSVTSGGGIGGIIGGGGNGKNSSTESIPAATGDLLTTMTLDGGTSAPTATRTVIGGGLVNGGDNAPVSTPTGASSGSGGASDASGLIAGAGVVFSVFVFGVAGLCLL